MAALFDRSFAASGSEAEVIYLKSQDDGNTNNNNKRKRVDSDAKVAHIHFTSEQGRKVNEIWVYSQTSNSGFSLLAEDPTLELNALQEENNELQSDIEPLEAMAYQRGIALEDLVSNIVQREEHQEREILALQLGMAEQRRINAEQGRINAEQERIIAEQGNEILDLKRCRASQENLLAKFQIALDAAIARLPPLET